MYYYTNTQQVSKNVKTISCLVSFTLSMHEISTFRVCRLVEISLFLSLVGSHLTCKHYDLLSQFPIT